ncbi:DsbA family protein [Nocardioides daejeonensis]|uniref:DsbA family protein n=1 Tax=Nocardioides daejeonensis TaxID=1046556 RepID=UPI000D747378|nr:thioredoxin domain-containing protein [Nocardioides daejeonensis]
MPSISSAPRRARLAALALVALVGVTLVVLGTQNKGDRTSPAKDDGDQRATGSSQTAAAEDPGLARRAPGDPLALGSADAPVVIVEYADFRCPFCARFTRETLPALVEKYVETGLVRYEFRDVPLFGDDSLAASVAGRAAGRQGRFWEFLSAVHAAAPDGGHPPMPTATLLRFAREAGVADLEQFERDLDDDTLTQAVDTDAAEARAVGATSVPFFAIDNVAVSGAQPLEVFEEVIEKRLAAHGVAR